MRQRWPLLLMAAWLTGCAVGGAVTPEPREAALAVPPDTGLREAIQLLVERGYVIRHADAELGRADAVLARWPGYRVRVEITAIDGGSRVALTATRGERPLSAELLDPLLADLEARLHAASP